MIVAALVVVGLPAVSSGVAHAATTTVSEATVMTGDLIGATAITPYARLYRGGQDTLTVSDYGPNGVQVTLRSAGAVSNDYVIALMPPPDQTLAVGDYLTYPSESGTTSRVGIGGSSGISFVDGSFAILDIAFDGNGVVTRLWATYDGYALTSTPGHNFGELKVNEPVADSDLLVGNSAISWRGAYPHLAGERVPVWLVNTSAAPMNVTATAISGPDAGAFAVVANTCLTAQAPGAICQVTLRFTPFAAGPATATLTLTDTTATGSHSVALRGMGFEGNSAMFLRSQPGDYAGGGGSYDYTPADSEFSASGNPQVITLDRIRGTVGYTASVQFAAPPGQSLVDGQTYDGALRYPFNGTSPGLVATVTGGCNGTTGSFTIKEIAFAHGALSRLSATFVQHCDGSIPTLSGWVSFHATDLNGPLEIHAKAPATSVRDAALKVTGSLVEGITPLAAATIAVSRKDLSGTFPLPGVVTAANGSFAVADAPHVGGAVTYTMTFAGDATHGPASRAVTVVVSRLATRLTLTVSPAVSNYGGAATATVRLGPTAKTRTIQLWRYVYGAPNAKYALVFQGRVTSAGTYVLRLRMTRNLALRATFVGDAVNAPATALSRASARAHVVVALVGAYRTVGSVHLYRSSVNPVFVATVLPSRGALGCVTILIEGLRGGRWIPFAAADCVPLSASSRAGAFLSSPHPIGVSLRVRAYSLNDIANASGTSGWTYLRFTK